MKPFVSRMASFQHNIFYVKQGRVLDVGCGSGWCLDNYKALGWDTHGIEMGADSAEVARKGGHDIFLGELREAGYRDNTFDAVTLWDTLEHVYNPAETIRELARICKPGGRIYTYVPNYGSAYAKRFRDRWFMFTAPLHYYHYTSETLRYLLATSGLTIEDVQYPLGGAGIQPTLAAAYSGRGILGSIACHSVVRKVLRQLDRLMPRGHLLMIARKPA
jgi:SAM-dependent methyltransferase